MLTVDVDSKVFKLNRFIIIADAVPWALQVKDVLEYLKHLNTPKKQYLALDANWK